MGYLIRVIPAFVISEKLTKGAKSDWLNTLRTPCPAAQRPFMHGFETCFLLEHARKYSYSIGCLRIQAGRKLKSALFQPGVHGQRTACPTCIQRRPEKVSQPSFEESSFTMSESAAEVRIACVASSALTCSR